MLAYQVHLPEEMMPVHDCGVVSCIKKSYEYDTHIIASLEKMQKSTQKYIIESEKQLDDIDISLTPGDRIFFV
jgi:hypothetical protein